MPSAVMDNGLPTGIGDNIDATTVTAFIRQQPWYLEWLAKNGITPGPDQQVKLSDRQRQDLANLATQHGIGLNNKFDQFDENGQVSEAHHKLKKTLIAAAIGGAALTGLGAAGIGPLAGAFAGGASAAGGGAALAPEIASTTGAATGVALPTAAGLSAGAGGTTAAVTGAAGGASTLGKVAKLFGKDGAASDIIGAVGSGIGGAATAAGNNRLTAGELAQRQQQANTSAQSAYESELMNRAKEEQAQRAMALKQQYAASYAHNRTAGPNNTAGLTQYSPEYLASLDALSKQGGEKLGKTARYDTDTMDPLKPTAMDLDEFMKKYGQPSTMEKVGNWLSPTLSTLGKVAKYF